MARLESVAVGGYFKTPPHLIPHIRALLSLWDDSRDISVADPCAGDGEAITMLVSLLGVEANFFTCELEASRHKALKERFDKDWNAANQALYGDAFKIDLKSFAGLLYLNPPYDTDPVHGRLEERFLSRFTQALSDNGILVFLVPHYALKASADTLALEYEDVQCFRFPDEDFEAYKQVVLIARKAETRPLPDPEILSQVKAWSESAEELPVLGEDESEVGYAIPPKGYAFNCWSMRELDLKGLTSKARPWSYSAKAGAYNQVPHILPSVPVEDLMFREYRIATAPRPAHIASGIASGLFNGRRVTPKTPGLPDLLVKGVFDREFVTIEEKQNKDGEVIGEIQVQRPKLVTTILDLDTQKYTTLKTSGKSRSLQVDDMSLEDLLDHYGPSLMQVMSEQCPVAYDPKRDAEQLPLAPVGRTLYRAQEHASKAMLQLLGGVDAKPRDRKNRAAILLGEIGSGKTSCTLATAQTIAKRVLVMCPPHLLDTWKDEVTQVAPHAEFRILENVSDVDALCEIPSDRFVVAVLSRETAKLGHGWEGVSKYCPKCGAPVPKVDLAKKRVRCSHRDLILKDRLAQEAYALALRLAPFKPNDTRVSYLLQGRFLASYRESMKPCDASKWEGFDPQWIDELAKEALTKIQSHAEDKEKHFLGRLLTAHYSQDRIVELIQSIGSKTDYYIGGIAHDLLMLLPPRSEIQQELRTLDAFNSSSWYNYDRRVEDIVKDPGLNTQLGRLRWDNGTLTLENDPCDSLDLAFDVLVSLVALGSFGHTEACGEPLFQAVPEPRRYPLSKYITRHHPRLFDLFVADECHEYASDGSAQERAAHRINNLGIPTIYMSGSIMNGYADSLFTNMWALSPDFRAEFGKDERVKFVDRYGYRKRLVTDRDKESGEIVTFGSVTDRVERSERMLGDAPGILPLFLFRHLLPLAVTIHKADLAVELPPCRQIVIEVDPGTELTASYESLKQELVNRIKRDRFKKEYAGKLFGALAEIPSYLDRCTTDTGNQEDGSYQIRYPESLGGDVVATGTSFDPDEILAKEDRLLEILQQEFDEGRNVMVFPWHVNLLPRLSRLIKNRLGVEAPILNADKVPTGKRKEWITRNIVRPNRQVMLANPVAIQTGLNNLVHFSTQIWMENPAVNPTTNRQAIGRVDRIGQRKETRIYTLIYRKTLQVQLQQLLLQKVAVATATDGLDPESALIAAGASDSGYLSGLSIGKQLWAMLNEN